MKHVSSGSLLDPCTDFQTIRHDCIFHTTSKRYCHERNTYEQEQFVQIEERKERGTVIGGEQQTTLIVGD